MDTYLCDGPSDNNTTTTKDELMAFFKDMVVMRRVEIMSDGMYKAQKIRGFCHLYDGQEAVCVGIEAALSYDDSIITSYRDHCWHIARTADRAQGIKECFGELLGKATGCSHGKGGSMHMYQRETNFYGGNGIVGAQCPVGTGLAFAKQYKGTDHVAVTLYGDGAANQGQLFEAMNIAALWKIPIIYVCENNHYGMGTAINRAAAEQEFYKRGQYIPGIKVDGQDVLAVREAFKYAAGHCRAGEGPFVIEADTYRYHGHSMSDPGVGYRDRKEIQHQRKTRDPIEMTKNRLMETFSVPKEELKAVESEMNSLVENIAQSVESDPEPPLNIMYEDIFEEVETFVRGVELSKSFTKS